MVFFVKVNFYLWFFESISLFSMLRPTCCTMCYQCLICFRLKKKKFNFYIINSFWTKFWIRWVCSTRLVDFFLKKDWLILLFRLNASEILKRVQCWTSTSNKNYESLELQVIYFTSFMKTIEYNENKCFININTNWMKTHGHSYTH